MSKRFFYARLAAQGMRKNGKFYLPYLLTCIGSAAMYYITRYLQTNEGLIAMRGTQYVESFLFIGSFVIALFSAILLFYTNSFLMKRRGRELGLYSILGMEKRHIARVMLWETVYITLIGVIGGLAAGVLLSKLALLLLCAVLSFEVPFGFNVSITGVWSTAVVFCVIFFLNLLTNLRKVGTAKPIELLYSGNTADREPKTNWPTAITGLVTTGIGYFMAATVTSRATALGMFFIAVTFVIIGTYCLFTAGSIAVLKLLRKNKGYYYKTKHFIAVSGMLHRMKRNAQGLASVCILSTMVLVTVSSTFCLYIGTEDSLSARFPHDITLEFYGPGGDTLARSEQAISEEAAALGLPAPTVSVEYALEAVTDYDGKTFTLSDDTFFDAPGKLILYFITYDKYVTGGGTAKAPASGTALAQTVRSSFELPEAPDIFGYKLGVSEIVNDFPLMGSAAGYIGQIFCFVVSDEDMYAIADSIYGGDGAEQVLAEQHIDVECSDAEKSALCAAAYTRVKDGDYTYERLGVQCRADKEYDFYMMDGGFFFLGIFLGFMFLMATVLIIYYKQISEGYEDAGRFRIMQQIGMSEREVAGGVRGQIMTVFFLPLAAAGVHIIAAFPMITCMLVIFSLYNKALFALCCLGVFLAFSAIYALIYALTARSYYRIVKI